MRFAPCAPPVGVEFVSQDGEEPCLEVGAGFEAAAMLPGFCERGLRQILGQILVLTQGAREGAQERYKGDELALESVGGRDGRYFAKRRWHFVALQWGEAVRRRRCVG